MAEIKQGFVSVALPEGLEVPAEAGQLTTDERRRRPKARRAVGAVALATADDLERAGGRISVPGVTPELLREKARRADAWEPILADLRFVLSLVEDANLIDDGELHEALRRVLAEVRAREKFDPAIAGGVPGVVGYFKNG